MSDDSHTEVSSQSWFDRIRESIKGVLFGVVLFVAAFPLLWWNEGRAVQTAKSLEEGASAVVSANPEQVDPANEGKLVHLTGKAETDETLADPTFGISEIAIQLKRTVEMYQWKENKNTKTERTTGGSQETITTYTYERIWSSNPIQSSNFKKPAGHHNPSTMPFPSTTFTADEVTVGAFKLNGNQIGRIAQWEKIPATKDALANFPAEIRDRTAVRDGRYFISSTSRPPKNSTRATGAGPVENGDSDEATPAADQTDEATDDESEPSGEEEPPADAAAASATASTEPSASTIAKDPEVGDLRVSFSVVKPTTVSLIAAQVNDTFEGYQTEAGDKLDMLKAGKHSAAGMFESAMASNRMMTWILRLVGLLVMMTGVALVFRPLSVVADFIPLFGDLLRTGTLLFAFAIAAPLSLLVIAIAWVFYRPIWGICLIVVALVIVGGLVMIFRKKKPAPATQQ